MKIGARNTFAQTTATGNLSLRGFGLTLNHPGLSQNDFTRKFYGSISVQSVDGDSHMVDNYSFFSGCYMAERSRPSFERLETKGETVLPWDESVALIDHRFVLCEHVPCLIVTHLEMSII